MRCTSLMLLGPSSQYVVKKSLLVSLGTRERRPPLCRLLSWWEANDMKAIHRQSLAIRLRDSCPMNPNKRNGSEWEAGHKLKDAGDNVCVLQSWELKTSRGPVVTKLDNLQEQRRSKRSCSESSLLSCDPRVKKATHSRKDSSILPFELTENILVRLPLRKLIQACTVCKEWRSVIQSESFRDLRRRQELDAPDDDAYQLMLFAYDGVDWLWSGFDFTSKRWRSLPSLTFLPSPNTILTQEYHGLQKRVIVAGAGGLVSVCVQFPDGDRIFVCNPVTRAWKELPPLNHPRSPVLLHMTSHWDRCKTEYRIIVAGSAKTSVANGHLSRITEVYSSATGMWTVAGDLPPPNYSLNEYQNGVNCKGLIYCVLTCDSAKGIIGFNLASGEWEKTPTVCLAELPSSYSQITSSVVNCGGRIIIATEHEWCKAYTRISVHSHSRHPSGNVKLIGQWGKLGVSAFGRLHFFYHGNDRSKLCAFDRVDQQLLVFDMCSSSSIVPDTILSGGTFRAERQNFFSLNPLGFVFKPSLFAPI